MTVAVAIFEVTACVPNEAEAVAEFVTEPAVTSAAVVVYEPVQLVLALTAKGLTALEQSTGEIVSSETR